MNYFGSIFAMVACIVMSAYFSATETAFSSLNKTRLKVLADNGNKRAALALKLSEDYDKLISTILIGNNIVNIMVASIGTLLFVGLYGDIGATVSTVVVTIVVLIFGEITPKSVAKDAPERFALFSAPFIRLWIWVLTPLNFLFSQWKKLVSRFFKTDDDAKMSHEELLLFMEDVEQDGGIDENEGELLRNALEFRDLTAAEILTHRIDLEAVDIGESHEEIARAFTQSRFSRLLVYRDIPIHALASLEINCPPWKIIRPNFLLSYQNLRHNTSRRASASPLMPLLSAKEKSKMKQSQYNSYDDLPLFLNADIVAKVLGVSSSTSYELMHEPDFPVLNVGSRMVVPKEAFIQWVTKHTEGGVRE